MQTISISSTTAQIGLNPLFEEYLLIQKCARSLLSKLAHFYMQSAYFGMHHRFPWVMSFLTICWTIYFSPEWVIFPRLFHQRRLLQIRSRARKKSATAQPSDFQSAKLTHVRNAQKCATSDFDAVFWSGILTRSALIYQWGIFIPRFLASQY